MENLKALEEKIVKVVDKIKALTEDNRALQAKIKNYLEELKKKDEEIKALKQSIKDSERLRADIDRLNNERSAIKSQVEDLLKELDSVEFMTKEK